MWGEGRVAMLQRQSKFTVKKKVISARQVRNVSCFCRRTCSGDSRQHSEMRSQGQLVKAGFLSPLFLLPCSPLLLCPVLFLLPISPGLNQYFQLLPQLQLLLLLLPTQLSICCDGLGPVLPQSCSACLGPDAALVLAEAPFSPAPGLNSWHKQ